MDKVQHRADQLDCILSCIKLFQRSDIIYNQPDTCIVSLFYIAMHDIQSDLTGPRGSTYIDTIMDIIYL